MNKDEKKLAQIARRTRMSDLIYDYLDVVDAVAIKVSHVRKAAEQFKEFGTRKYCEHEGE